MVDFIHSVSIMQARALYLCNLKLRCIEGDPSPDVFENSMSQDSKGGIIRLHLLRIYELISA
jgi:hypothetical protein